MTKAPFPSGNDVVFRSAIVRGEAAGRLGDLASAAEDLKFAQAALLRLAGLPPPEGEGFDLVLERSLWNSAHAALSRPFMSGKGFLRPGSRTRLDDIRQLLSTEHEATLVEALEVRNRHVAHSVNSRESVVVHADFWPPELGGALYGVGLLHATNNSDRDRIPALLGLAQSLLDLVGVEDDRAYDAVMDYVHSREPELRAAASVQPEVDAGRSRQSPRLAGCREGSAPTSAGGQRLGSPLSGGWRVNGPADQ